MANIYIVLNDVIRALIVDSNEVRVPRAREFSPAARRRRRRVSRGSIRDRLIETNVRFCADAKSPTEYHASETVCAMYRARLIARYTDLKNDRAVVVH